MEAFFSAAYRAHAFAIAFGAYALGVISISTLSSSWIAMAGLIAATVIAALLASRELKPLAITVCAGLILGSTGGALALRERADLPYAPLAEHHVVARVVVIDRPRPATTGLTTRVRIIAVDAPIGAAAAALHGQVALFDFPTLDRSDRLAGQLLRVRARLSLPAGPRNDGEPAERDELDEQGVSVILAAPSPFDVKPLGDAPGWEAWWARLRLACARAVEARLPPLEATVLEGILWGDRGQLPATLRQEFSDTGTVHVLTTAGLHLGIFAALVGWLLLQLPIPRALRTFVVVIASWSYAALAGLHVPTIRAATMLTAGAIAYESGRGRSPSAVLAAAGFAVALPHPLVLLSPSFSMSFACVGGIALLSPALHAAGLSETGFGLPPRIVELARTNLAVQIALWPLQALYFDAITPWALFANLLVVPLVGVIMALGGALLAATAVCPPLLAPLSNLTWWVVSLMIAVVDRFASLPNAHVDVPPPTHAFLVLYWLALAAAAWALREDSRRRHLARWSVPALAVLVGAYIAPGIGALLDPQLRLDAIDVGQADCILIRAPGMHAMLVDGGGRLERNGSSKTVVAQPIGDVIATRTVMPFLLRHWVLRLDAVVLTHPHGDHAGGLPIILERENVGVLYDSAQLYGGPAYQRALDVIRQRRVRYRVARRGESFDLGTTHVKILEPELPLITGSSSDINNNSVVLRVEYGKIAILLTGDAQSEAEARLLSHGAADLQADILKVGHHGSAYSSTPAFLAAVHPKIAIISCGLHNVFGHPSPRTLEALRAIGAQVFRTDLDGGVSVKTDGSTLGATVVDP